MTDKDQKNLVQEHAMKRLSKVEKEQRRAYKKEDQPLPWKQWVMMALLLVVLGTMVFAIF